MSQPVSSEDGRKIWEAMRVPVFSFVALVVFLAGLVGLGWFMPGRAASFI